MKLKNLFFKALTLSAVLIFISSCEDDFQNVGSGLVNTINFTSDSVALPVTAYTKSFINGPGVQTSSLPSGALGYYKDAVYGNTTASVLSQIVLSENNPNFGDNPVVDSVVLSLPYYSNALTNAEGNAEYSLDSVYGNNPIQLTGYRSNYFLSQNTTSDLSEQSVYYSDQLSEFEGIEGDVLFNIPEFNVSNEEIVTVLPPDPDAGTDEETLSRSEPAARILLDNTYWQENIIDQEGNDVLFNDNSFRNYFRGIYIKSAPINEEGTYFLFDLSDSKITIYYTEGEDEDNRSQDQVELNFRPANATRTISMVGYNNEFNSEITTEIQNSDFENGEENLYLKGGQGSIAIIDLFGPDDDGDGIPENLQILREEPWLIREANMVFYVDQDKITSLSSQPYNEPERIYIYNLETNQPVVDYSIDATVGVEGPVSTKVSHLGRLIRDDSGNGIKYTIRLTEYLKSLLSEENETPDTKLGLVVSQNVNLVGVGKIENTTANNIPNAVPFSSILSQQSTILHGNLSDDEDKKLQLNIYYTESISN